MPKMPNETEVKREEGWYWIRRAQDVVDGMPWQASLWHSSRWWLVAYEGSLSDSELAQIGPRCINPIEKPLDAAVDLLISNAITDMLRSPEFKAELDAAVKKAKAAGAPDGN